MTSATLIQPTGELWQKIRLELNEDVNTRDNDLAHIKEWLKKQPHLPDEWDECRIMTFLRGCNFSLEKTKRKLDMYFTMRAACPEFFENRDITRPEFKDLLEKTQGSPLPGLTPNGRRVTIARATDESVDAAKLVNVFKVALMIGDIRLKEEKEGVGGDVYILDARFAVSPSNLAKVTPALLKKFLICVQEAYPVKLKEVHVVNVSPLIEAVLTLVKPFLKEKLRDRIFIHSDMNTLYDYVPRDILPEEYGGHSGSLAELCKAWVKKLEEYGDWFKEQESIKANEVLRPGKPTNYDELFGIDGSFRQLSID